MKISTTATETKKIEKEIELPYYSQDIGSFMMIAKNEAVIMVKYSDGIVGYEIVMHEKNSCLYDNALLRAAGGKESSAIAFVEAYNQCNNKILKAMNSLPEMAAI